MRYIAFAFRDIGKQHGGTARATPIVMTHEKNAETTTLLLPWVAYRVVRALCGIAIKY